jgi:hypothetical protein
VDLQNGLKYLGFIIKPGDYRKEDWAWLTAKFKKRSYVWCFRWISRGGRLKLKKSVLEAIPVYWISLAFTPKGVLDKLRQISLQFLWSGSREKKGIPLFKWDRLAVPKGSGGWGLKNHHLFVKALAAKNVWTLIVNGWFWSHVIVQCTETYKTGFSRGVDL